MRGVSRQQEEWFDFSHYFSGGQVQALLSRRNGDFKHVSLDDHRSDLAGRLALPRERIAVPRQVHGNKIMEAQPGKIHDDTDGLITADPQAVLSLQVADCVPIFMYHPGTGLRGLVHAGWRGAVAGIVSVAVTQMVHRGARARELEVLLGPSIEQDCYEVGDEVYRRFPPGLSRKNDHGKYQFDLAAALRLDLAEAGLEPENIHSAGICTHCNNHCHSYRRDGAQAGRMIGFFYETGS